MENIKENGEWRWTGSTPPVELRMTGPSNSEPENKNYKWFEIKYDYVKNNINVNSNCLNCRESYLNLDSSDYGINGFCWYCQRYGLMNNSTIISMDEYIHRPRNSLRQWSGMPDLGWGEFSIEETKTQD